MSRWAEALHTYRAAVGGTILLLTFFFAWQTRHLIVTTQFRDLYPTGHPHTRLIEKYPHFDSPLAVQLVVQVKRGTIYNPRTLGKIQTATKLIDLIPGVDHDRIFSLASPKLKQLEASENGVQSTTFLVGSIPDKPGMIAHLRNRIRNASETTAPFVSPREDAALIYAAFVERLVDYDAIFNGVNAIVKQLSDNDHEVYAAGAPMLTGWVHFYKRETFAIVGATLGAMVLLLALHARNLCGIATPIIVSIVTAIWGLGLAALLRISLDPLIVVLPMLLIARSLSHAIQACDRYFEIYAVNRDKKEACIGSLASIFPPGLLGILTDAAGLFLIALAPIPLMQKVALAAGLWSLCLIPANLILTPIVLSFLPPPANVALVLGRHDAAPSRSRLSWVSLFDQAIARLLEYAAYASRGKIRWATGALLALVLLWSVTTAPRLVVGDQHSGTSLLHSSSDYNIAVGKINERFAGFDVLQAVLESDHNAASIQSPAALELMQRFQRHMERDPAVGATFSLADMVSATNRLLHGGLPKWGVVPDNPTDAAMISQLAMTGASPSDFDRLFTRNLNAANITLWYKDHRSATILAALRRARTFHDAEPASKDAPFKLQLAAGTIGLSAAVNETVSRSQWHILWAVLAMIFLLCSFTYRSVVAALLLLVPVNFANLVASALMVRMDIGLDINTLPVLALGTGVGIDYAIYLLSRIREEFPRRDSYEKTVVAAIVTTGRAILFTASALVVGLFPWYFLSSLRFQGEMALLIAILMIVNMIAAIVVIPLLIGVIKPRFLGGRRSSRLLARRFRCDLIG